MPLVKEENEDYNHGEIENRTSFRYLNKTKHKQEKKISKEEQPPDSS